jgi:hypothetical protein
MDSSAVMKEFFEDCVDKIIELIKGHVDQINRLGSRTKVNKT